MSVWLERSAAVTAPGVVMSLGCFNAAFPVTLALGGSGELSEQLRSFKEQVRGVSVHGEAYALLRELGEVSVREALAALPEPELGVRVMEATDLPEGFQRTRSSSYQDPRRPVTLEATFRGDALELAWRWPEMLGARWGPVAETVNEVLKELSQLAGSATASLAPSDFPDAALEQGDLDSLMGKLRSR